MTSLRLENKSYRASTICGSNCLQIMVTNHILGTSALQILTTQNLLFRRVLPLLAFTVLVFKVLLSAMLFFTALYRAVFASASFILWLFISWKFHVTNGQNSRLSIQTCLEGHSLNLNEEGRAKWLDQCWRMEKKTAYKTLVMIVMEGQGSAEGEKILE